MQPKVRKAEAADAPRLAIALSQAFEDDPVSSYTFPSSVNRLRALERFFGIELRHEYLGNGEVYTTEDLAGAALWAPPGKKRPGLRSLLHLMPMLSYLNARLPRVMRMIWALESRHPKPPHFYLGVLGVEPDQQHRGVGSALMAPVLARCDADQVPAYLESSKESNVPFYSRHGFEVTEKVQVPSDAPPLWLMWREPRAAADA